MDTTVGPVAVAETPAVSAGRRPAARLATTLGLGALAIGVAGVVLQFAGGSPRGFVQGFRLYELIAVPSFGVAGMVVAARRPGNAVGWVMLAVASSHAVAVAAASYADVAVRVGGLPGSVWALWISTWIWVPGLWLVTTLLLLLFPDGRAASPVWRVAAVAAVAGTVFSTVLWALVPYDQLVPPVDLGVAHPFPVSAASELLGLDLVIAGLVSMAALASLVVRFRRSGGRQRRQIKGVAAAGVMVVTLVSVAVQTGEVAPYVVAVAIPVLPVAITVAIVRHGLWDIDLVLNRSLVYGVLTLAVLVVYVVTVTALGRWLGASSGAPLVATALVALGIQPARERVQRLFNRLLYGEGDDPYQALSDLARRLDAIGTEGQTIAGIAEAVARALRMSYVAIEADGATVAVHGQPVARATRLALTARGMTVGEMVIAGRVSSGEDLSTGEQRLLADLTRQVGAALHGHRLTRDLQQSRERLVNAREEERRRLHRDLHDDIGPVLAASALQLDRARDLVIEPGDELLQDVAHRLRTVVVDLRTLVEDLRPRALDDVGLPVALHRQAAHFGSADLKVTVDVPDDLGSLSAGVEVAAYRIVSEALNNVARHARAHHVHLTTRRTGSDRLDISVSDDGIGLDDGVTPGVGLSSMRERAEELGGSFRILRRPAGGTRVEVCLPVAVP